MQVRLVMSDDRIELDDAATFAFYLWHLGFWIWSGIHYTERIFLLPDSADDGIGLTRLGEVINVLWSNVVGLDLVAL
jgi:hypothetical protein